MKVVREIMETMEYGPSPEGDQKVRAWLDSHGRKFGVFIDGEWREPGDTRFPAVNPATEEVLAEITESRKVDVDDAVRAAASAFPSWSAAPGPVRARYLYALARQLQKRARFFAVLESMDNGKPIRETRDFDVPMAVRWLYHHAGWAQIVGDEYPDLAPVGVVGQIIPWNFPLLMLAWKVAPALAAGNTVVLKPAEQTSLTALAFAELCQKVGLPAGVVNIVTGGGQVGEHIVDHPEIAKLAFTGSTEVGRLIRKRTAGSGKRLTLELGGKSPFIVFDDADLDSAIEGVVNGIWFNQGEVCCAGSRLLVQESIAERFLERLRLRMERLRVGDPLDKGIDIGAVIDGTQLERVNRLVEQGESEGASRWQPPCPLPDRGFFYPPTLFTDVSPAATIAQEEIFGPVLVSYSFRTPAEAVQLANNTRYGLAASVWTENINLALDVAAKIKAGTVWINNTNAFDAAVGFGGYRESGFGREGGIEGLREYLAPAWEKGASAPAAGASPLQETENFSADPNESPEAGSETGSGSGSGTETDSGLDTGSDLGSEPPFPLPIDRTAKMYIGGKQVRPDSGYAREIVDPAGRLIGEVGDGNRKDIRNAVEAAHKAASWGEASAHHRAQVLYYIAENLSARMDEFAARIDTLTGCGRSEAEREVEAAIQRLFTYAAWADKYDGHVHRTALTRHATLAMPEPIGVIGIVCPHQLPLLGFVSLVAPAIAMGNTVVVVPSEPHALAATDLYQVLDTSDVPGGVVNIVTGDGIALGRVLAEHDDVDSVWYFGEPEGRAVVEEASAGNMKRTWVDYAAGRDWYAPGQGEGRTFLWEATQIKNIWIPYGE